MPAALTYPGVYIEEIPSGVRTITGVATSITAFIGRAQRGPVNEPVRVQSFAEFERAFGGLWVDSTLGYAVVQFFQNGGGDGLIVRVYRAPSTAQHAAGAETDGVAVASLEIAAQGTLTLGANPADTETMTLDTKQYTFDALIPGKGTLAVGVKPSDGATMTIGSKTYTFKSPLSGNDQIFIDGAAGAAGLTATQANIVAAINGATGAGTLYSANITPHPDVTAGAFAANKLVLTAKAPGSAGNSIVTTETFANASNVFGLPTPGHLSGGTDVASTDGHIAIGADKAATQANIVAAINLTGTAGTQYATSMVKHPTVTAAGAFVSDKLVLTAKTPGNAGNTIVTTETLANAGNAFDPPTPGHLSGGAPSGPGYELAASSPGVWANNLRVRVDHQTRDPTDAKAFNLEIREINPNLPATAPPVRSEKFLNVSVDSSSPLFVDKVLESGSKLARVTTPSASRPEAMTDWAFAGGSDGQAIGDGDIQGVASDKTGINALEKADLFNLLCIPPVIDATGNVKDLQSATRNAAARYCEQRRALFVADPSNTWATHTAAISALNSHIDLSANAALFFPMLRAPDPLRDGQIGEFAPCGAVAGVMARTDATRGVWKAPAGIEATLNGVSALSVKLTDGENGQLNPLGVNCLRSFPVIGRVVWGSRTMRGADQLADQWKYIPVRRLALFLEESLFRGTQWVVFEPNDEPLWAQIRLNIGAFMHNLFRQGAFQGMTPRDAYFVKCNKDTTTQNDIDLGIVNIIVGFAPLKPAEFVVIKIQQIAGQIQT